MKKENLNIPVYRGKKIDSDEYFEGLLVKGNSDTGKEAFFIQECDFWMEIQIDPTTLAIHFPDMIDSQGNKIFASLSEYGKGGDIGQNDDYGYNKYVFIYNAEAFEFGIKLIIEENTEKECWEYECLKNEYLELFRTIGIQK